jgi:uncharacterized protein YndB with AHSA1/START domain
MTTEFPATPERVYQAWLDSREHARFTGGEAKVDPTIGGEFAAWDGYISGRNLELEPGRRIVQSWRTTEFPDGAEDSRLEVLLEAIETGTRVTLIHTNIPAGDGRKYELGWHDFYFDPMKKYFRPPARMVEAARAARAEKAAVAAKEEEVAKAKTAARKKSAVKGAKTRAANKRANTKPNSKPKPKSKAPSKGKTKAKGRTGAGLRAKATSRVATSKRSTRRPAKRTTRRAKRR